MTKTVDGINLRDFVELLLGRADSVSCPDYIAEKLFLLDPEETFVHIERPNTENGLARTHVWDAKAWKTAYAKYVRTKELSARERQVHVLASEKRAVVVRKLCAITGLTEEQAMKVAIPLIRTRNEAICKTMFGMNLADLMSADLDLNEYKTKIGAK